MFPLDPLGPSFPGKQWTPRDEVLVFDGFMQFPGNPGAPRIPVGPRGPSKLKQKWRL